MSLRRQSEEEDKMKTESFVLAGSFAVALNVGLMTAGAGEMGKTFGAPYEGMSVEEYQALVFLDPQNTVRIN